MWFLDEGMGDGGIEGRVWGMEGGVYVGEVVVQTIDNVGEGMGVDCGEVADGGAGDIVDGEDKGESGGGMGVPTEWGIDEDERGNVVCFRKGVHEVEEVHTQMGRLSVDAALMGATNGVDEWDEDGVRERSGGGSGR